MSIVAVVKNVEALQRDLKAIDKKVDKATLWALREVGRKVKQTSRREAPVYKGPPRMQNYYGVRTPIQPGALKKSISSSKQVRKVRGTYRLTVAPRTFFVHYYAPGREKRSGFMRKGWEVAEAVAPQAYSKAWSRVTRK